MKKIHFSIISMIIVFVFLFASCGKELESDKSGLIISSETKGNNNDQGEDKGNGKKPPIVDPPIILPYEYTSLSVSIDYGFSNWCCNVIVKLTLSEGLWDTIFYNEASGIGGNPAGILAREWISLSLSDKTYKQSIFSIRNDQNELVFMFIGKCDHYTTAGVVISEEQKLQNFGQHLPITVIINEEKLAEIQTFAEIKTYPEITDVLIIGTKSATLNTLKEIPQITDPPQNGFQIVGIWICETIGVSSARYWRISVSDDMSFIWQRSLDGDNWLPLINGNVTVNDELINLILSNGEIRPITVIDQNKIKISGMVWEKQNGI